MTITYWTGFNKRKNSTKQPTGGTNISTVVLKDDTSIMNPVFDCVGLPANVNYIQAWGKYYFVRNVTHVGADRLLVECECDVLATYKSNIGSYNGFKEYSAASSLLTVRDPRNTPTALLDASYNTIAYSATHFNAGGCYVIGVLNDNANGETGVVTYYAMTAAEMILFTSEVYSQSFITQITNQFQAVQDSFISCMWLPLDYAKIPGASLNIHIGRETMVATGKKISNRLLYNTTGTTTLTFPSGSGAGNAMKYIDLPPYTTGLLYLPFVGIVPINIESCAFTKQIEIKYNVDILTGDIVYQVYYGGLWSATFNGNIATKMPITGASYDGVGVATGALTVIGGAVGTALAIASEGGAAPILGGVASMLGGSLSAAKSMELHTMINGSNSSAVGAKLGLTPYYVIYQYQPSMTNLTAIQTEQGLPVFDVETTTAGYNKFNNASVSIAGTAEEKDILNDYLNTGFYYE